MTAFSRQSSQSDWGSLLWEVRTVNHRYLDLSIRLPEVLRCLEPAVRELLGEKLRRGKVEATLRLTGQVQTPINFNFNEALLKQLAEAVNRVQPFFSEARVDLFNILNWPGLLETETLAQEAVNTAALELLESTLDDLVKMRQKEGAQIKFFIQKRLKDIREQILAVEQHIPKLQALERQKINLRVSELGAQLDPQRLEQEMAILIQKSDVSEELQRLSSHCQAMDEILSQRGAVGRRLDFLSQELNREANTLSSKSLNIFLTQSSIEMKVLIEQIREQVQNIE